MKKLFYVLLIAMICYSFVSCNNQQTNIQQTETSTKLTEVTIETLGETESNILEEYSYANKILDKYVNLKNYESFEIENNKIVEYEKKTETKIDLPEKINIENRSFSLPVEYIQLKNAGFESSVAENEIVAGNEEDFGMNVEFVNKDNRIIKVSMYNPYEKDVPLKACKGLKVTVDTDKCPEFNLNGITNNSNLQEIVEAIGEPHKIEYNKTPSKEQYSFYFEYEGTNDREIRFYGNEQGTIKRIIYELDD